MKITILPPEITARLMKNHAHFNDIPDLEPYPELKRICDATPDSHPSQIVNNDPLYLKFHGITLYPIDENGDRRPDDYVSPDEIKRRAELDSEEDTDLDEPEES